jgi:predicted MFS family arabinose efflux permease
VLVGALTLLPFTLVAYGLSSSLWWAVCSLFIVGLVYIGVLSGLSTVVQLRAPTEYRGRVLSFYLVALGVAYPVGALVQGPLVDRFGLAWTTGGAAALLAVAMLGVRLLRPGVRQALVSAGLADRPAVGF